VVFGAILGTGVGGRIVEWRLLTGLNRIGGEWGQEAGEPSIARHVQGPTRAKFSGARKHIGVIVLGGGILNVNSLYVGASESIAQYALSDGIKTKVVCAAHGDSSGVRGAAWLWPINKR
jgi:fructokinase